MMDGLILGMETSCDETALAVFSPSAGMAGEWVSSQIALHAEYGGVVPELASREHLAALGPMLEAVWEAVEPSRLSAVAVTHGPGLAACLAVGVASARTLGLALGIPVVPVNHLRAHALSPWIPVHAGDPEGFSRRFRDALPHLGLIASGGNTLLFRLDEDGRVRILAETGDDAAGEALDKGAKLMGLGYPGGPRIEQAARSAKGTGVFRFPKPIPGREDARFSFSGLKTALRNSWEALPEAERAIALPDLCLAYEGAVVEALERKTREQLNADSYASIGLSGGVANNARLREAWARLGHERDLPVLRAEPRHTGDNASMVAFAAWLDASLFSRKGEDGDWAVEPSARLEA